MHTVSATPRDSSSTSGAGHIIAISTWSSTCARAIVSFRRHRYNSVTASRERLSANLVLTEPGLGALAMMTSVRFGSVIENVSPFARRSITVATWDFTLWHAVLSSAAVVARDPAENKPRRSDGAAECAADLGFSGPGGIAHRDLDDPETLGGSL